MTLRRFLIRSLLACVVMTGASFALNLAGHAAPIQYTPSRWPRPHRRFLQTSRRQLTAKIMEDEMTKKKLLLICVFAVAAFGAVWSCTIEVLGR